MKRLRLSAKLALAIIPIGIVALGAAGFIAFTFLGNSEQQNETAHAATVSADAIDALKALWDEEGHARQVHVFGNNDSVDDLASAIERTDEAIQDLRDSTTELQGATDGFFGEVAFTVSDDVRAVTDELNEMRSISNPDDTEIEGYHDVANAILAILPKTSSIVSDRVQARDLYTAYYLAEGGQVSLRQEQLIEVFRAEVDPQASDAESTRATLQGTLEVLESEFGAWALRANQTANIRSAAILRYTRLPDVDINTFPLRRNEDILNTSEGLAQGVADESQVNAADSETEAYLVAGVAAFILILALAGSYMVIRSVVRRVRSVTDAAVQVSEQDLPALVDALQNPNEDIGELKPTMIEAAGKDEVGDLAESFTLLHSTLIDVAGQQMDILRKGVSEIFVTLARRNRSLVDRQLALLDDLESTEEDPAALGGYYKLDHLATRMRRNAESLLVLAGSEPTRIWSNPLDISEIIRAALGEVDDYQRVDIMALEPALISGRAVADVAHLMSELLDNGTQFSSPVDRVRVAGLFDPDGYMLTVSDSGIGMINDRIAEFNVLLDNPPVLGLALQPTLGMYVVARLAARHGVKVQLISGSPGVTVRVLLPKSLIEPAPAKEALPGETVPALPEKTVEYRPAASAASNGSRATFEPALVIDADSPDEDRPSALPGKIKGRHEHPGRFRTPSTEVDEPDDQVAAANDVSDEEESSPFATESEPQSRPGALKRRVPGEALSIEQRGFAASEAENPTALEEEEEDHELSAPQDPTSEHDSRYVFEATPVGDDEDSEFEPVEAEPVAADAFGDWRDVAAEGDTAAEKSGYEPKDGHVVTPSLFGGDVPAPNPKTDFPWWLDEDSAEPASGSADDEGESGDVSALMRDDEEAPSRPDEERRPRITQVGLPVRTPGVSFREKDDSAASSAASTSGAIGIRSALSEFSEGRTLATQELDAREDDADELEGSAE